jgi:hypothetical protein
MDSGEYTVYLAGREASFVDAASESDPYPAKLWEELGAYFEGLEGDAIFWPSGRFACAQALAARGPSCLAYRSLGELVHMVQLSIGQKKILGYQSGHLVPYKYSELMEKEKFATCQQPVASSKKGMTTGLPLASWEDARSGLCWLLAEPAGHGGSIQLPNVKRLFRSELFLELSETALGYARIFELLHDAHMSSVCDLRLEGKNWMVVRKQVEAVRAFDLSAPPAIEAGVSWPPLEGAPACAGALAPPLAPLAFGPAPLTDPFIPVPAPMPDLVCKQDCNLMHKPLEDPDMTRNAFRCLSTTPLAVLAPTLAALPLPLATATAPPSQFENFSSTVDDKFETASYASTWDPMEGDLDSPRSTSSSSNRWWHMGEVGRPDHRSAYTCPEPEEPVEMDFSSIVKNTFIHVAPSPTARRSSSVPGCMRLGRSR